MCGRSSYPQVSSYTPPWINSETYTPFISAVFLSLLEYWFASVDHSPRMHIAWVTITLGDRVTLATGSQFLVEVNWIFCCKSLVFIQLITLPLDSLKSLRTDRSNRWTYENDLLFKPTNHFTKERAKCLSMTVFFRYLSTLWPQTTFLIASVLMCSIPWLTLFSQMPHQVAVTRLRIQTSSKGLASWNELIM